MRDLVLPISPGRANIIYALSVFTLFVSPWCAQEARAHRIILPALRLQTQSAPAASDTEKPRKKKGLVPLRQEESPEGSRVTITYNAPLSDYSAYRRGDRFVVVIPKADAPRVRGNLRGRGFDDVQVEKRGDDTVFSFRIQPGARARVDQQFNRLEVVFNAPEQPIKDAASDPRQTAAAPSQVSAGKASQARQSTVSVPQTLLANHNSTAGNTTQPDNGQLSRDSSVEPAGTAVQALATVAPGDSSPAPSAQNSVAPARSSDDKITTVQPAPAVSPADASTSLSMMTTRYWLPLSIAALLLASAYAIIASRRRAERNVVEPAIAADETEVAAGEAEAIAPRAESLEEMASAVDEEGSTEIDEEVPGLEVVELAAATQTVAAPVSVVEAGRALVKETPARIDQEQSRIPITILSYLGSEDANERAAGVLGLADLGSDEAFRRIGAAFDDPVEQVRDAAARSLFNVSVDRAASFKRLMRESSTERRRRVGAAIFSSGMASEAISDLSNEGGERAYDALLVLSLMARAGEVQFLIETIEEHPDTEVCLAIVKLLALSGQPEILRTFSHLAARDSLPIAVRSSIMEAIYQLNNLKPMNLSAGR
jgi:hypothetical protein